MRELVSKLTVLVLINLLIALKIMIVGNMELSAVTLGMAKVMTVFGEAVLVKNVQRRKFGVVLDLHSL